MIVSGLANGVKKSLTFDITCNAPTFASVNVTVDKANIAEGETANISITDALMTDGSVADLDAAIAAKKASISFEFDDEIVDVSSSERTITYVAEGTTTVTVAINYYGVIITKELEITCGVVEPVIPTLPAMTLKNVIGASITLKDEILLNIKFQPTIPAGYTGEDYLDKVGVLVFNDANIAAEDATYENADSIIANTEETPNAVTFASGVYAATKGVAAKNMGDLYAYVPFVKNDDGSVSYGKIKNAYSPSEYCYGQYDKNANKELMIAMLNYGAAAQIALDWKPDDLMNKRLPADEQKTAWDGSLVRDDSFWTTATVAKQGALVQDKTVVKGRGQTLLLKSAIEYSYKFQVADQSKITDAKVLVWTEDQFNAVDVLTPENASEVKDIEWVAASKYYEYVHPGSPARKMFSPVYVCAVFTVGGVDYYSGVVAYCPETYGFKNMNKTDAIGEMARTMVVYGDAARTALGAN